MGAGGPGKREGDGLIRVWQLQRAAAALATRPGWSTWGVDWLMRTQGMCPACLEIGGRHDYWCRFGKG